MSISYDMTSQLSHRTTRVASTLLALGSVMLLFSADVADARSIESSSGPSARRSKLMAEVSPVLQVNDSDTQSNTLSAEGKGQLPFEQGALVHDYGVLDDARDCI